MAMRCASLALILLIAGCSRPATHVVAQAVSPDRSKIAVVYAEDPLPLVGASSFVYIHPAARPVDRDVDLVFQGDDMDGRNFGPVNIQWSDNDHLDIAYCDGRTETYRNYWFDRRAKQPAELVVALDFEPRGEWPPATPPQRRAGSPPCN
ncbi:MAG TPA: hypothetical protein VGF56_07110 [Rhizomicrobium sp.]|jgi:hypothetical protein